MTTEVRPASPTLAWASAAVAVLTAHWWPVLLPPAIVVLCGLGLAHALPAGKGAWRGLGPYALLPALALPGALMGGSSALATWAGWTALMAVGAWADVSGGREGVSWVAPALRGAGAGVASARLVWYVTGRPEWSLWYRELSAGESAAHLSVLEWSPLALALMVGALPLTVHAAMEGLGRTRIARLAEAGLLTAGICAAGGLLGLGLLVLMALTMWVYRGAMRLKSAAIVVALCVACGAGALAARGVLWPRLKPQVGSVKAQLVQRAYAWETTTRLIRAHPLGIGPGRFADRYGAARRGDATERHQAVARPVSPQCDPLLLAAEGGLPAAAAATWLVLAALCSRRRPQPERAALCASLTALALLACLSGLVFSPPCAAAALLLVGRLRAGTGAAATAHRLSFTRALGVMALVGASVLSLWPMRTASDPQTPMRDDNSPEWLLVEAVRLRDQGSSQATDIALRALGLYPARRAALAANRESPPKALDQARERHAQAAELIADLHADRGGTAAADAFLALAAQIRAAPTP